MTISDGMVIVAIIVAPIIAIQIQKFIESKKEKRAKKMQVFINLMATRAIPLAPLHVQSLNMIDIEFYKNKKVTEAWKLLLDNFENYPKDNDQNYKAKLDASSKKSQELLANLLYEMSRDLGYDFDKVHLMRGAYIPRGHADVELDQGIIRRSLARLFLGEGSLPIKIVDTDEEKNKTK